MILDWNMEDYSDFYINPFYSDILLDSDSQADILSRMNISEIKNTINYIVWVTKLSTIDCYHLTNTDKNNLQLFLQELHSAVYEVINKIKWSIASSLEIDNDIIKNKIFEYHWFIDLVYKIENKYYINVSIDNNEKSLTISNKNWDLIWKVLQSRYTDENLSTMAHLYNVVQKKYRWKWYGMILYKLYTELSKIDSKFFLPKIEYTNVVSMINFYTKNWFKVKSKFISWIEELISSNDFEVFKMIKNEYLSWLKERNLPYTVVLEKK